MKVLIVQILLSRKFILSTYLCCRTNADKLKHEEKYDGRIGELKIDTKTSFLRVLPSDEVDQVAS